MQDLLYKGQFLEVHLIENQDFLIFKNVWQKNSEEMEEEDFKHEVGQWCQLVEQHHARATMVDTLQFGFLIPPDLQDWYNTNINTRSFNAGMRKLAFLVPEDIFSQVSIKQIFDDQKEIVFKYFVDENEALTWLKE